MSDESGGRWPKPVRVVLVETVPDRAGLIGLLQVRRLLKRRWVVGVLVTMVVLIGALVRESNRDPMVTGRCTVEVATIRDDVLDLRTITPIPTIMQTVRTVLLPQSSNYQIDSMSIERWCKIVALPASIHFEVDLSRDGDARREVVERTVSAICGMEQKAVDMVTRQIEADSTRIKTRIVTLRASASTTAHDPVTEAAVAALEVELADLEAQRDSIRPGKATAIEMTTVPRRSNLWIAALVIGGAALTIGAIAMVVVDASMAFIRLDDPDEARR